MNADWPVLTLGDVCEKITDGAHNSPKSVTNGKPMASVKDLTPFGVDLSDARLIPLEDFEKLVKQGCQPEVGDVLIAKDGNSALDTVCTVDEPLDAVMLSSVAILRPDKTKLDSDFLKYYFTSKEIIDYLKSNFISGAAIPRVVLKDFRRAQIKIPPLRVQKEISNVLSSLDKKIKLNRQINQTLEQMAQAIFKSWFVDFDPVRAKMEGRDTGLPAHIADFFPDELEESELGPIPNGWAISTIGNEVEVVGGGTPSTQNADFWDDGEYYWTTPKDLSGLPDKVLLSTERKITKNGLENISSGLLPINTVLMSSRAPVGYLVLAKIPTAINQGFIGMKCNKQLSPEYVLQWANSKMADIKQRASGSTFAEISKKTFRPMGLAIPTKDILAEFTKVAECIYSQIAELVAQSNNLATTRDLLLPKLLSGAIEVKV